MATLIGDQNDNTLSGTPGNDTISGLGGNDLIYGNMADDLIYGNQGDDRIYGGQGNDTAFGGQGNDTLYGNQGNDVAYGNLGNDIVYGNQGNDVLYGGMGNDTLYGGMGDDILVGGVGDNVLVGGQGNDTAVFAGTRASYTITQDAAGDFILSGADGIDTVSTVENFQFSDGTVAAANLIQGPTGGGGGGTPPAPTLPTITTPSPLTVDEANLPSGTQPDASLLTQADSFQITAQAGVAYVTVDGTNVSLASLETSSATPITVATNNHEQISIDGYNGSSTGGTVDLAFELIGPDITGSPANPVDNIAIGVTDSNSASASTGLAVTILHDTPQAISDSATVNQGGTVTGDLISNDQPGADGPVQVSGVSFGDTMAVPTADGSFTIAGNYGTLSVQPDGTFSYVPQSIPANNETDSFEYSISDQNGSTSMARLNVQNIGDAPPVITTSGNDLIYTKGEPPTQIDKNVTVSDADGSQLTSATVQITNNFQPGEDVLGLGVNDSTGSPFTISSTADVDGFYQITTTGYTTDSVKFSPGTVMFEGTDTHQHYEDLLDSVTYTDISNTLSTVPRTVTYTGVDEDGNSSAGSDDTIDFEPMASSNSYGVRSDVQSTEESTHFTGNSHVLAPHAGHQTISDFIVGGPSHDTLSIQGADFGNDIANVLNHTHNVQGGVVINDPTTQDKLFLSDIHKGQLVANTGDFTFNS